MVDVWIYIYMDIYEMDTNKVNRDATNMRMQVSFLYINLYSQEWCDGGIR
jgi:hypothetical protein